MQKILFLWCFCLLSTNTFAQFTSAQQVIDQLNGNWQWIIAQGGFTGETITPVSSGMTASYHITQNPTDIGEDSISIQTYANGELIAEGKAKVVVMPADGWAISGADLGITIFGGGSTFYPIITLNNTYLILNDNIGDGYTYYFEKININISTFATPPTTATTSAAPTRAHLYFPMNDWVSPELLLDPPFDSAIPGAYRPPFTDWRRVGSVSARSASLCRWTLVRP